MWHSLEVRFGVDHPTAAGHFPGNPIIPGAVLLDEVLQAVAGAGGIARSVIRSAKFLQPVRPGDAVVIRWESDTNGQAKFECRLLGSEQLALTGMVLLEATAR
jgi:3-hydroxymyristoyl/3-hydroxydecanoyl-(acyl carrier protein) dehydratase